MKKTYSIFIILFLLNISIIYSMDKTRFKYSWQDSSNSLQKIEPLYPEYLSALKIKDPDKKIIELGKIYAKTDNSVFMLLLRTSMIRAALPRTSP